MGFQEIRGLLDAFERIVSANGRYSGRTANQARLFRVLKELFKYLRGDPRVYNFYEVQKGNLKLYSLDWLYGSGIDRYKALSSEFSTFLIKNFHEVETQDFMDE